MHGSSGPWPLSCCPRSGRAILKPCRGSCTKWRPSAGCSIPTWSVAHDAGEVEGQYFLAMEYLDGTDLARIVQAHAPLTVADACEVGRQTALGLQYAHEHGLVHRDVKPSNLMLTKEGTVKVLDLGLARLSGEGPDGAETGESGVAGEMTGSGQIVGTGDYLAPEQAIDSHAVDIRADIYALGCTLYKLPTGLRPF